MLELSSTRKNKINLTEINFQQEIECRRLLSDFSPFDFAVLNEILFSPLKIPVKKLSRSLNCSEEALTPILDKLSSCSLLKRQDDELLIDKERRKHFEFQINRFQEDFQPNMEFLQGMLKQVPIHILPSWYAIPRSSNNIFESLVEKYLQTPQVYQRYLMELNFANPLLNRLMADVFSAPDFRIASSDLIAKYNLSRSDFDFLMLTLEFHLICFVTYVQEEDHWHEFVTPFHEWRQYLLFLQETETPPIQQPEQIFCRRMAPFAFLEDMAAILTATKKKPLSLDHWAGNTPLPPSLCRQLAPLCSLPTDSAEELRFAGDYLAKIIEKLFSLKLADQIDHRLYALESANDWLDLKIENRALNLYRHPLSRPLSDSLPAAICTDRNVRESANTVKRALHGHWVFFDEFILGVLVALNENSVVMLKRVGKQWKFSLPEYTEEEKSLIKASIFEWLFECGMVAIGSINGRDCFSVTPFGQFFFEE